MSAGFSSWCSHCSGFPGCLIWEATLNSRGMHEILPLRTSKPSFSFLCVAFGCLLFSFRDSSQVCVSWVYLNFPTCDRIIPHFNLFLFYKNQTQIRNYTRVFFSLFENWLQPKINRTYLQFLLQLNFKNSMFFLKKWVKTVFKLRLYFRKEHGIQASPL